MDWDNPEVLYREATFLLGKATGLTIRAEQLHETPHINDTAKAHGMHALAQLATAEATIAGILFREAAHAEARKEEREKRERMRESLQRFAGDQL